MDEDNICFAQYSNMMCLLRSFCREHDDYYENIFLANIVLFICKFVGNFEVFGENFSRFLIFDVLSKI